VLETPLEENEPSDNTDAGNANGIGSPMLSIGGYDFLASNRQSDSAAYSDFKSNGGQDAPSTKPSLPSGTTSSRLQLLLHQQETENQTLPQRQRIPLSDASLTEGSSVPRDANASECASEQPQLRVPAVTTLPIEERSDALYSDVATLLLDRNAQLRRITARLEETSSRLDARTKHVKATIERLKEASRQKDLLCETLGASVAALQQKYEAEQARLQKLHAELEEAQALNKKLNSKAAIARRKQFAETRKAAEEAHRTAHNYMYSLSRGEAALVKEADTLAARHAELRRFRIQAEILGQAVLTMRHVVGSFIQHLSIKQRSRRSRWLLRRFQRRQQIVEEVKRIALDRIKAIILQRTPYEKIRPFLLMKPEESVQGGKQPDPPRQTQTLRVEEDSKADVEAQLDGPNPNSSNAGAQATHVTGLSILRGRRASGLLQPATTKVVEPIPAPDQPKSDESKLTERPGSGTHLGTPSLPSAPPLPALGPLVVVDTLSATKEPQHFNFVAIPTPKSAPRYPDDISRTPSTRMSSGQDSTKPHSTAGSPAPKGMVSYYSPLTPEQEAHLSPLFWLQHKERVRNYVATAVANACSIFDENTEKLLQKWEERERSMMFKGLGHSDSLPIYLRASGLLRNLRMTKMHAELIVKEIWALKAVRDEHLSRHGLERTSLSQFFCLYLVERFPHSKQERIEFSYNLLATAQEHRSDADLDLFLGVLTEDISEDQCRDHVAMLSHFKRMLLHLDQADGACDGYVDKNIFFEGLRAFFPYRSEARLRELHAIIFDESLIAAVPTTQTSTGSTTGQTANQSIGLSRVESLMTPRGRIKTDTLAVATPIATASRQHMEPVLELHRRSMLEAGLKRQSFIMSPTAKEPKEHADLTMSETSKERSTSEALALFSNSRHRGSLIGRRRGSTVISFAELESKASNSVTGTTLTPLLNPRTPSPSTPLLLPAARGSTIGVSLNYADNGNQSRLAEEVLNPIMLENRSKSPNPVYSGVPTPSTNSSASQGTAGRFGTYQKLTIDVNASPLVPGKPTKESVSHLSPTRDRSSVTSGFADNEAGGSGPTKLQVNIRRLLSESSAGDQSSFIDALRRQYQEEIAEYPLLIKMALLKACAELWEATALNSKGKGAAQLYAGAQAARQAADEVAQLSKDGLLDRYRSDPLRPRDEYRFSRRFGGTGASIPPPFNASYAVNPNRVPIRQLRNERSMFLLPAGLFAGSILKVDPNSSDDIVERYLCAGFGLPLPSGEDDQLMKLRASLRLKQNEEDANMANSLSLKPSEGNDGPIPAQTAATTGSNANTNEDAGKRITLRERLLRERAAQSQQAKETQQQDRALVEDPNLDSHVPAVMQLRNGRDEYVDIDIFMYNLTTRLFIHPSYHYIPDLDVSKLPSIQAQLNSGTGLSGLPTGSAPSLPLSTR